MGLEPLFQVAGIAFAGHFTGYLLEETGNGKYVTSVKIVAWCAAAWIAFKAWEDTLHHVAHIFHIML